MNRTTARPASPETSNGWMKPSRPSVVSGVSVSPGSSASSRPASRAALTSLPIAQPGWMSTPSKTTVTSVPENVSSWISPGWDPSSV